MFLFSWGKNERKKEEGAEMGGGRGKDKRTQGQRLEGEREREKGVGKDAVEDKEANSRGEENSRETEALFGQAETTQDAGGGRVGVRR